MKDLQERLAAGDMAGALAICERDFSDSATSEQQQLYAQVAVMNQHYDLAVSLYQTLLEASFILSEQDRMFYGISLDALDRTDEAIQVFVRAFGELPESLGPCRFLATLYTKTKAWERAVDCYHRVLELSQEAPDVMAALLLAYVRLADFSKAYAFLQPRLLHFDSQSLAYFVEHRSLESILLILESMQAWDDFLAFSTFILEADLPFESRLLTAKTLMVFVNNNHYGEALLQLCRAVILQSDQPLDRFFLHLFVHNNYRNRDEINLVQQRLLSTEETFMGPDMQAALKHFDVNTFEVVYYHSIYHGYALKPFLMQLAKSLKPMLPSLPVPQVNRTRPKARIAVVSYYFYPHSVMHFHSTIIQALPKEYEIYLISLNGQKKVRDYVSEQFSGDQFRFVDISNELYEERCRHILDLDCDLILYTDVHMNSDSTVLAMNRLAPIQCCGLGHPTTTGMDTIDYYLSAEIFEPEDAESHYTESLVQIKGMPLNYQILDDVADYGWDSYGFSQEDHVYFCPMVPFKIMPEFDDVIEAIYDKDPKAQFVFVKYNGLEQIVQKRQQRYSESLKARILWFDAVTFSKYLGLLKDASVVLDTFPFSGGNTVLHAFYVGTPVATCQQAFLRGRFTQGYYRLMGLESLVHQSVQDYVSFAVRCASDPLYRADISATIMAQKDRLFHQTEGVDQLIAFLTSKINDLRAG